MIVLNTLTSVRNIGVRGFPGFDDDPAVREKALYPGFQLHQLAGVIDRGFRGKDANGLALVPQSSAFLHGGEIKDDVIVVVQDKIEVEYPHDLRSHVCVRVRAGCELHGDSISDFDFHFFRKPESNHAFIGVPRGESAPLHAV